MLKRPHYIALGLVVLLTLIMLNLPSQTTARIKLSIGSFFLPLFGLAGSAHELASRAGEVVITRGELLKQNAALRQENKELHLQLTQAEDAKFENARFRQLFGFPQRIPWKVKLARVVLRDPANWWHTVQIDLGSRNGLRNNMPVLSPEGALVGRISAVSFTRSQVVLVGDPNCKVAARVDNEAHDTGVVEASGPVDTGFVEMGYLSKNASLKPGQDVKTSGLGGIFPDNIPIGKIVDSQVAEFGLGTIAQVKLAANLDALEDVWVLIEHE